MKKVKLEVWKVGPHIIAPEHCIYRYWDSSGEGGCNYKEAYIVHPSVCSICKLCDFTSDIKDLTLYVDKFINYLTLVNTEVSTSINHQSFFLRKNDRIPLFILINPEIFDSMLKWSYQEEDEIYQKVHAYYLNNEIPLCYILGCPVYLSRKLTKSKVMVVGEIEWK